MKALVLFKRMLIAAVLLCFCTFQSVWAQQTIVIGPSAKANHPFSQFDSLLKEVSAGKLAGQITFAFESGTYTFTQALIINTANATAKDHYTITSVAKNRDSVTFTGSISGGLVQLNSTNNVTFSHVSIQNTSSSGMVVAFMGATEGVTFYHCNLTIPGSATSGANSVIGKGDKQSITTPIKNFALIGNTLSGGCRNYINTASTNHIKGFRLDSNRIVNTYDGCFTLYYADDISCNFNVVIPRAGTTTWPAGLNMAYCTGDSIYGNFVDFSQCTQATFGGNALSVTGDTSSKKRFLIANNVFIGHNNAAYNNATSRVISLTSVKCDFIHNSVYNNNTSNNPTGPYSTNGVFMLYVSTGGCDIKCVGNQFITYNGQNQYPLYVDPTAVSYVADYNNYCTTGSIFGYYKGTALNDLAALQSATKGDSNSVNVPVSIADLSKGLALTSYVSFLMPNVGINSDYENTTRGKTTSMGAYTVILKNNDASLADFAQTSILGGKSCDIYVTLTNMSLTPMTSATIQWMDGSKLMTPYKWTGKLALGEKDTIKLGSVTPLAGTTVNLTAWSELPNGVKDENTNNDTITLSQYVCNGPFKGTVTVGKGNDFATLDDALDILNKCGINGPVTIEVDDATYTTLTISGSIKGASDTNTVTIKPSAGSIVTIDAGAKSSFIVDGASHWVFEGLTIGNTTDGLIGVEMKGQNEDVTFRNCRIYANVKATASSCAAVYWKDASTTATYPVNVRFTGNTIQGGYYNVYFYITSSTANLAKASIYVDHNTFLDAYYYGYYSYYTATRTFNYNTVTNRQGSTVAFYGMYASSYGYWEEVIGNRIHLNNNNSSYGLYFGSSSQYATYNNMQVANISNNEITTIGGTGTRAGVYFTSPGGFLDVHHNSIYASDTTSGTVYGMYLYNTSNAYKLNASNNLVYCDGKGTLYPMYISSTSYATSAYGVRGYNNLYSPTNVAYIGGAKTTVAALQSATSGDANTISVIPVYDNMSKSLQLKTDNTFSCPKISSVPYDITGARRGNTTVMGCYNFIPKNNDAALDNFAQTNISGGVANSIFVTLSNMGATALTSATIQWSYNGTLQTPFKWTGKLNTDEFDTVKIGSITPAAGTKVNLTAWVELPNGMKDEFTANDTVTFQQYACKGPLSGKITTGKGKDFANLDEVLYVLRECGISAPVTIEMDNDSMGQVVLSGNIKGSSVTNTITLKPSAGSSVTINAGNASSLIVDGISNWTIDNLTIGNTTDGLIGVEMKGQVENVTFSNCRIYANAKATASTSCAVRWYDGTGTTTYPVNVRFTGNTIQGGYANLYFYATSSTTNLAKASIYVDHNTLLDAYYYAYYNYYTATRKFNYNTISNRNGSTTTFYGLYSSSYGYWEEVIGNRIRTNNNSTAYGLYFGSSSQYASYNNSQVANISNNEIILISATGTKGGIYVTAPSGFLNIMHNSIYVSDTTSGTEYGLYISNSSTSYKVNASRNLIFCDGKDTRYPLYASSYHAPSYGVRAWNNLYSATNVAYASAAKTTVAALQAASTQDSNTISELPVYYDMNRSLQLVSDTAFLCPMDSSVMYDINGNMRNPMTAMGCYGSVYTPAPVDAALTAFVGLNKITASAPGQVSVVVANKDQNTALDRATITLLIDGVAQPSYNYAPKTPLACGMTDTVNIGSFKVAAGTRVFTAFIDAGADTIHANDTIVEKANICAQAYAGTYIIGNSAKANCTFAKFDSLINEFNTCGAGGDITLAFEAGTYTFTKAMVLNTSFLNGYRLYFTSVDKDRDSVIFTGAFSGGLVQLNNTNNVTFSHVTFQNTSSSGMVVAFMGATENVTFYHCTLIIPGNATSGANSVLGKGDKQSISTPIKNFKLIGNIISGGCRNHLNTAKGCVKGFRLDSNSIVNTYDGGFIIYNAEDFNCNYNTVIPRNATTQWPAGFGLYTVTGDSIYGNIVNFSKLTQSTFGGAAMSLSGDTSSSKRYLIANNVFIGRNNGAYKSGISKVVTITSVNCDFVHNSIFNTRASNSPTSLYTTNGVFPLYLAGAGSDIKCVGNQIVTFNGKNQYPIWVDASMKKFVSDYNNYYTEDTTKLAYVNGSLVAGMAALAKATGGDAHSVCIAPVFVDSTVDLDIKNYSDYTMPNIGINEDFAGNSRVKTNTMGAFTGAGAAKLDAAVVALISPNAQSTVGQSYKIKVLIANKGTDTLTSLDLSHITGGPFLVKPTRWTGKLATGQTDTATINVNVIVVAGTNNITVACSNPNASTDDNKSNDTLRASFVVASAPVLDIEVSKLISPDTNSLAGVTTPLKVEITNKGTDTLKTVTIVNIYGATKAQRYNWTGTLLPGKKDTVYLRDVNPSKGKNTVQIYISQPNGVNDANLKNDTLNTTLNITREPGDASLTEFIGLEKVNPNIAVPVYVVVYNKGAKAIDKATINFSINGSAMKPYTYQPKVALAQYKFDTVNIGSCTAKAGKTTFIASIAMLDDKEPTNDTIRETREVYYTDYKLNAIVSPKAITEATCFSDKTPIAIAVSNEGKLDADFTASKMTISISVSGATTFKLDTAIAKGMLKAGKCDTFLLGNFPTIANGTYTINVTIGGSADYDTKNNTAKTDFNRTSIAIPYDNNLSAQSKELVFNQTNNVHWDYAQGSSAVKLAPVYGKGFLEFAGEKSKGDKASIVMNGVQIQNFTAPKLSFWYAHSTGKDQGDVLSVKVTTDGGATYTELGKLKPAALKAEWKRYDFDLTKFSSAKCLSIVMEATSAGMNQAIDRIMLTAEQDAAISLLPIDMSKYAACSNNPVDVKAVITNVSDMDVELKNDTITFNVSGAINANGKYVYSNTLKAKATDTLTLGQFVPAKNGNYIVNAYMQSQDDKTANDTASDIKFDVMQDLALTAISGIDAQTVKNAGDTVTVKALLVNKGNTVIRSSKVQLKVNGNEVANLTANNIMGAGDTNEQVMSYIVPFATKANPTYTLEVIAGFDCDGDSTNNAIQIIGKVNVPDTIDVQVLDIFATDTMGKAEVKPTVRIANIGNVAAANVKLHVTVYDSADNVVATMSENIETINMNDTLDYACATAYNVPNYTGMYRILAYVEAYTNDNDLSNDTLSKQFNCHLNNVGISESYDMNWTMGQNYPNPASNVTRIPFSMPQDATVVFSVMSVNGQMIYREVLSATAGSNTVDFNVSNLANGVYYYSMECNGQRFVKKMNVAR